MARPRPVYRGKRKYGWIITVVLFLLIFALMGGIWVFYNMQKYIRYEKDGLYLDFSEGETETVEQNEDLSFLAPPVTNAQIIVEMPNFSTMENMVTSRLKDIQALYVSEEKVTAQNLAYYPSILAESQTKYNCLVLNIKSMDGNLRYYSTVPMAGSYGVNGTENLKEVLGNLKEHGLWLVAELSCLGDSAMAVRNSPISLKNANGGVLTNEDGSWLDPYNSVTREYIVELMRELKEMGFDEVLLTNFYLPADMAIVYSQPMSASPDIVSAVSSLGRYLREQADDIGICLSAELIGPILREGKSKDIGQDGEFFFKVFDRVYVKTDMDYYVTDVALAKELCSVSSRVVTTVEGFNLPSGSYFVR